MAPVFGILTQDKHSARENDAGAHKGQACDRRDRVERAAVALRCSVDPDVRCRAAFTVCSVALCFPELKDACVEEKCIPSLVSMLGSGSHKLCAAAVGVLDILLEGCGQAQAAFCAAGGVPVMLGLMRNHAHLGKERMLSALSKLQCGTDHPSAVVAPQDVAPLVALLSSTEVTVAQQALRALSFLAAGHKENRASIAAADAIPPLTNLAQAGRHKDVWQLAAALEQCVKPFLAYARPASEINARVIHAAATGDHEGLRKLLAAGGRAVAVGEHQATALHHAASNGRLECVNVLLERDADVDALDCVGRTPLHHAAWNGHEACVRVLLGRGANKEAVERKGCTPLHHASADGREACVRVLLAAGANPAAVDVNNSTALHLAAWYGRTGCVGLLVNALSPDDRAVVLEARDKNRRTAVHHAAAFGHDECLRLLLGAHANPNPADRKRKTPLHHAAARGKLECVKMLAATLNGLGVSLRATDEDGHTALNEAVANGKQECAVALVKAGACNHLLSS